MVTPPATSPELISEAREFLAKFRSAQLATASKDGVPLASYAPFAMLDDGSIGMLLSELATHTQNLRDNASASLLFIEPEADAAEIFARRRLSFSCSAKLYSPGSAERAAVVSALKARFGNIAEQLASLPDFYGVVLKPDSANYVAGFARAQQLPVDALLNTQ
ncbi:MAG: pyridoxamine 5'-phosphate oxidase family protein [Gammaproteobacteria bacterium]|nr:pyridoxamine 5'-phosphate oxidase family protein [Gammaproteobacteria bacterium]NNM11078.1 HugZ family protein [Pseudomonadales bacterium]